MQFGATGAETGKALAFGKLNLKLLPRLAFSTSACPTTQFRTLAVTPRRDSHHSRTSIGETKLKHEGRNWLSSFTAILRSKRVLGEFRNWKSPE